MNKMPGFLEQAKKAKEEQTKKISQSTPSSDQLSPFSELKKFFPFVKAQILFPLGLLLVLFLVIMVSSWSVSWRPSATSLVPTKPTPTPTPIPFTGKPVQIAAADLKMEASLSDSIGVASASSFLLSSSTKDLPAATVEQTLTINPQFDFEVKQVSAKEVEIVPSQPLTTDTVYHFALANETLPSEDDPSWAFQIKNPFRIINSLPRNEGTYVPVDSGIEITFSHENYEDIDNYFSISPHVDGRFERHKRTVVYVHKGLSYSTLYTVTVKSGLGLTGSEEKLKEDYVFQFETKAEPKPTVQLGYLSFDKEFVEFPPSEEPVLGFYAYSVPEDFKLPLEVFQYPSQDALLEALAAKEKIPLWAQGCRGVYVYPTEGLTQVLSFEAPLQEGEYKSYVVFPDKLLEGYYLVQFQYEGETKQSLLQVTDVATYLSVSKTKTLVWVNDVNLGQAVSGAVVNLVGGSLQELTDSSGIAYFTSPQDLIEAKKLHYFTINTPQGKTAVVPVTDGGYYPYYSSYEYIGWSSSQGEDYWSYFYLDRELYLPTDKINFWGLVKHRDRPETRPQIKIQLTKSDYYGYYQESVPIFETEITPSDLGTFHGEVPIQNLKPSYYLVQVVLDNKVLATQSLDVKEYTKPAYKISVQPDKEAIFAGETVNLMGEVNFFEGTPVSNLTLMCKWDLDTEVTTDSEGKFLLPYTPTYEDSENRPYPTSATFDFTPKLAEEAEITARTRVRVFGPQINLAAKATRTSEEGTEVKVSMEVHKIVLDRLNDGTAEDYYDYLGDPVPGQIIEGKITETHWEKKETGEYYDFINKKVRKKYDYYTIREHFGDFQVVTGTDGKASYEFNLNPERSYEIKLEAKDEASRIARKKVYVSGTLYGWYGYHRESDYYYLATVEEISSYGIGDKVSLILKKGEEDLTTEELPRYLFSLAQRGFRDFQVSKKPLYEFNFEASYVPNIVANAVYFNGRTYFQAEALNLFYRKEDKELSIEINPDKETHKPAEEVNLEVVVKDKDGVGQEAEVNLSLVDEALFALQEQYVYTLDSLYDYLGSGILRTYTSHQQPAEAAAAEKGAACFLQGTPIRMAGEKNKPIEEVKVGDNIQTHRSERDSNFVSAKVTKVEKHLVEQVLFINQSLSVTPEHRMFINGRWQEIGLAKIGDLLLNEMGEVVSITSIEEKYGRFEVYNLKVENFKTYFAAGFYVHNDKGAVREFFADQAFFGVVKTDKNGRGEVSFKLPDNLTSWRITYQGVTEDLKAGHGIKTLPVRLPFFVDMALNSHYLVADEPVVKLRSFGTQLNPGEEVEYQITVPSLGEETPQVLKGKAFEVIDYKLPPLKVGGHKIVVSGKVRDLTDTLARSFKVYDSYLLKTEAEFGQLTEETKVKTSQNLETWLIFSDQNRGRFYPVLNSLRYTYGDRVDQRLARVKSQKLLQDYFGEEGVSEEDFDGVKYQVPADGGIALFPYSSSELDLSAKIAALSAEEFDQVALQQYFLDIVNSREEGTERVAMALYGLAALGDSVLVPMQQLNQRTDLSVISKLYLALGMAELGDKQTAREIYKNLMEKYGEESPPYLRLNVGRGQDDVLQATSLVVQLAGVLADDAQHTLYEYVNEHWTTDILIYLEKLAYAEHALPLASSEPVSFTYTIGSQGETKTLQKGETFRLVLNPEQAQEIKFSDIQGTIGFTQFIQVPLDPENIEKSPYAKISRVYSVAGQQTQNFKEGDLVKVQIYYQLEPKAFEGCYQVTDYLPSGLKAITKLMSYGIRDIEVWYPYEVSGQKVSFCTYRESKQKPIIYYARVISKGKYLAENALIQSQKSPADLNVSDSVTIEIQ